MKTMDLIEYGVDRELVDLWISEGIEDLLPIQTTAIIKHHLFDNGNLVVFSPTSSGKTFIGEMTAVNVTRKNQRALYLVPQKALAEEKYEEFRRRYKSRNIKIVVSTRDRKEYDRRINSGDYDIAVVVYEKMQSLLVSSPALLKIVGLVVIDELQMIGDPHRGADLEVLLTKILTYPNAPKIIGLSAVLGKAKALAQWMEAQLCLSDKRPMELRKGVQFDETYRYMEHNSKDKGTEQIGADADYSDREAAIAAQARKLAHEGEQCLIFRKSRNDSVAMARRVGNTMDCPPATAAIEELEGLEDSENKDLLRALLSRGVAYHNSDLDWEQRDLIERHFRKGDIRVLCSTSTLAMGMNLPVKNVFIDPEKWDVDHTGHWMRVPVSQGEYENMSGRAGRLGLERDFGRAILIADGIHQARTYWDYYIKGKPADIEPTLDKCPIEHHVLNFVASGLCKTRADIRNTLLSSFTGKLRWSGKEKTTAFEEKLNNGLSKCIEGELIEENENVLSVTELGRAVAIKGVTVDTALCLAKKVRNHHSDASTIDLFDMLFWINACPEGLAIHFGFSTDEYRSNQYIHQLRDTIRTLPGPVYQRYKKIEKINHLAYDKAKMLKKTLLLYEWVCGVDTQVLEKRFACYTGSIGNLGREFAWLAETLGAIAKVLDWPDEKVKEIFDLSARLIHGVPLEATKISTIKVRGLGRGRMKALAHAGLDTFDKILDASRREIEKLVTKPVASRLVRRIRKLMKEDPELLGFVEKARDDLSEAIKQAAECPAPLPNLDDAPMEVSSKDIQVRLIGKKNGRRYLVTINDESLWMRERSFTTLVQLAVAKKNGGSGWVKGPELATYDNYHQVIRRLREDIGEYGRLVENDRDANYRLKLNPGSLSLDVLTICCCMPESGLPGFFQEMGMLEDVEQDCLDY